MRVIKPIIKSKENIDKPNSQACLEEEFQLNTTFHQVLSTTRHFQVIMLGILKAKSPRISRIADAMPGGYEANYKMIQRFLKVADLKTELQRCFDAKAEFVIGDPVNTKH